MIITIIYIIFISLEIAFAFFACIYALSALYSSFMGSAYVPSKQKEVDYILKQAHLKRGQFFIDLGCGDGRVVKSAVRDYHVQGIGIDISPVLILIAKTKNKFHRVSPLEYKVQNVFDVDLKKADVVYIFLMPDLIKKLEPEIKKQLKKGVLVISHGFKIVGWEKYLSKTIHHTPFPTYFYQL